MLVGGEDIAPGIGGRRALARRSNAVGCIPWLDALPPDPMEVLCHIHREFGRLGMGLEDLSVDQRSVLHDVQHWFDRGFADALTRVLADAAPPAGAALDANSTPLRLRATVTRRGALCVRWEPLRRSPDGSERGHRRNHLRVVGSKTRSPSTAQPPPRVAHAENELIAFRKLGALGGLYRGHKAECDIEPLSILLIFLVRRCYELFINNLKEYASIIVISEFVFEFSRTDQRPFQQLRSWKITELQDRRDNLVALESLRGRARR
jgi:hypothetical protein